MVFIPKAEKINHNMTKDYRPSSLSSFLLKTMEKLIDLHVREKLQPNNFSVAQYAYLKGKSVETALLEIVGFIEDSSNMKITRWELFLTWRAPSIT